MGDGDGEGEGGREVQRAGIGMRGRKGRRQAHGDTGVSAAPPSLPPSLPRSPHPPGRRGLKAARSSMARTSPVPSRASTSEVVSWRMSTADEAAAGDAG